VQVFVSFMKMPTVCTKWGKFFQTALDRTSSKYHLIIINIIVIKSVSEQGASDIGGS